MLALRGGLRMDGAKAGCSTPPTLSRAHIGCFNTAVPRPKPTRALFVLPSLSGGPSRALQRRPWRTLAAWSRDTAVGGGDGDEGSGSSGGGSGGSGSSGGNGSNEGEDNNPGFSGNMWMLAGAAATVLTIFLVRQKLLQQQRPQRRQRKAADPSISHQQPGR